MCQDVEEAMAPVQAVAARPDAESHASAQPVILDGRYLVVEPGPVVVDVQDAIARQELVFADVAGH
jgi:hypothetical protein